MNLIGSSSKLAKKIIIDLIILNGFFFLPYVVLSRSMELNSRNFDDFLSSAIIQFDLLENSYTLLAILYNFHSNELSKFCLIFGNLNLTFFVVFISVEFRVTCPAKLVKKNKKWWQFGGFCRRL